MTSCTSCVALTMAFSVLHIQRENEVLDPALSINVQPLLSKSNRQEKLKCMCQCVERKDVKKSYATKTKRDSKGAQSERKRAPSLRRS